MDRGLGDVDRADKQLVEMSKRGWRLFFCFEEDGDWDFESGSAGDSNCTHRKEFDPKDSHGFSSFTAYPSREQKTSLVWEEYLSLVGEDGLTFSEAVDFAYRHIMEIVPGAKI